MSVPRSTVTKPSLLRIAVSGIWRPAGRELQHLTPLRAHHHRSNMHIPSSSPRLSSPLLPTHHGCSSLWPRVAKLSSSPQNCVREDVKTVNITFKDRDGDTHTVQGKIGDSLLEVAKEYDIDLEGACDGTLSCSTCHLVVDPAWFDKISDPLTEEEEDMLDLAYGLTETSRLGCQVVVSEALDGIKLTVPVEIRDAREL